MKIASWNVNGIRARIDHVVNWIEENQPDVLALQETKVVDELFPYEAFESISYAVETYGQKSYNGVANITKKSSVNTNKGIDGFDDPQTRVLSTTHEGIRVVNVYVPNGQAIGTEKFLYKLEWLGHLKKMLANDLKKYPKMVVLGDFNIAPNNDDVHDPDEWKDKILCSDQERKAFGEILSLGLHDSFRLFEKGSGFHSWWDYRAAAYRRGLGLRIDLLLASDELKTACKKSYIDEKPRSLEKPSDHTPVVIEIS
jgi:exodeoxyribonuclease-3